MRPYFLGPLRYMREQGGVIVKAATSSASFAFNLKSSLPLLSASHDGFYASLLSPFSFVFMDNLNVLAET
jgi:hypothetical protein